MRYQTAYKQVKEVQSEKIEKVNSTGTWIFKDPYIFEYFKNIFKNSKILDIGCYSGLFLNKLSELGFADLQGIDMADFAQAEKKYNLNILDLNKQDFPFSEETFDYVTGFQVMEHMENYFHPMHQAHRVLKKGGMFIFSVPNHLNIFNRIRFAITGNITSWNVRNDHMLFLTRDVFKKTFLNYFDLVDVYYDKGGIPFWGRLNKLPFVKVGYKKLVLPRCEFFGFNACYFLKKI